MLHTAVRLREEGVAIKTGPALRGALLLLGLILLAPATFGGPLGPEYQETKELVALVRKAAAAIREHGEEMFPAFRISGSEWFQGETSLFVLDMQGVCVCHAAQPDMERKDLRGLKDADGKPFIRSFFRAVSGREKAGWAHYRWPRPGQREPAWKMAYLVLATAPSGKEYLVGSGLYPTRWERMFAVPAIDDAAALLQRKGQAAFKALRDRSGDFVFGDLYLFVLDPKGKVLVHSASPRLEGQVLMDLKDRSGRPFVREMFRLVRSRGSGWLDDPWSKPGSAAPPRKSTYVREVRLGRSWLLVGAGVSPGSGH